MMKQTRSQRLEMCPPGFRHCNLLGRIGNIFQPTYQTFAASHFLPSASFLIINWNFLTLRRKDISERFEVSNVDKPVCVGTFTRFRIILVPPFSRLINQ